MILSQKNFLKIRVTRSPRPENAPRRHSIKKKFQLRSRDYGENSQIYFKYNSNITFSTAYG